MNTLYYGDNLDVLREHIADESVDLVYLDPPFKSDQNYNVLFAEQDGACLRPAVSPACQHILEAYHNCLLCRWPSNPGKVRARMEPHLAVLRRRFWAASGALPVAATTQGCCTVTRPQATISSSC